MNSASLCFIPSTTTQIGVLSLSEHVELRMQLRGVERVQIECLLEYRARQYDHKRREIVFLTDNSPDAIAHHESFHLLAGMAAARSISAVGGVDGCVVTMDHRYRRVQSDLSLSSFRPRRSRKPRRRQSRPVWYQFN